MKTTILVEVPTSRESGRPHDGRTMVMKIERDTAQVHQIENVGVVVYDMAQKSDGGSTLYPWSRVFSIREDR